MTKTVRIIIIFIILASSLIFPTRSLLADYLIRPIPDDNRQQITFNIQQTTDNKQQITDNIQQTTSQPSITFGDLLTNNPSLSEENPTSNTFYEEPTTAMPSRAEAIKKLLTQLDSSYQESRNNNQITDNIQQITFNEQQITDNPSTLSKTEVLRASIQQITDNNQQLSINYSQLIPSNNTGNLIQNPIKTTYTIALLGDSMTDTLGKDLPHLKQLLTQAYPQYSFTLINYGQGATDLDSGLYRLTHSTSYLGQDYPPLLSYQPDILVIESFAYNHWSGEFFDLDRQWLTIAKAIDTVKQNSPNTKIILAATIAPNAMTFGDGILNWQADKKWESASVTKAYLQNLINFAASQNYPLADAYHPSLGTDGNGLPQYINQSDHLHPSGEGAMLFSQKIIETIKENKLLE